MSVALYLLIGSAATVAAKEQSASINVTVPAGESQITRLRNLPKGAAVSITVSSDGETTILLLDEDNLQRSRATRRPLVSAATADQISLAATIPRSGTYYLLIDNQGGSSPRNVSLEFVASLDESNTSEAQRKLSRVNDELNRFSADLKRYFVFEELKFRVARCGTANAFSTADTVIICAEIGPRLQKVMGDRDKALAALHFAMMHEIGHVLLKQWGYPFHDNEEVADEFATALLLLFNKGERARSQAEYFAQIEPEAEFAIKRSQDDRHPLSVQRARNILGWIDDPELLRRWQKIFVPHLQNEVLEAMTRSAKPWIDQALVAQELSLRAQRVPPS